MIVKSNSYCNVKIAVVVVWYNPTDIQVMNVKKYSEIAEHVYVVDNSELPSLKYKAYVDGIANLSYSSFGKNEGIAKALNVGAAMAIEANCEWLLTMDQDSEFEASYISQMFEVLSGVEDAKSVGMLSAVPKYANIGGDVEYENILVSITSGNIVRLDALKAVGGWNNSLFIDCVDTELCLKLRLANYRIIQCNNVVFSHHLGDMKECSIFNKRLFYYCNYNYIRRYYITRNSLYINSVFSGVFKKYCRLIIVNMLKDLLKVLLCEDDKFKKMRAMYRGYVDFSMSKFNEYQE